MPSDAWSNLSAGMYVDVGVVDSQKEVDVRQIVAWRKKKGIVA